MKGLFKKLMVATFAVMTICTIYSSDTVKAATPTHTVNFIYGTKFYSEQVIHGTNAIVPTNTNQDGYVFTGWFGDIMNVTEDRTILGCYYPKTTEEKWTVHPTQSVPDSSWPLNTYGLKIYKQDPTIRIFDTKSAPEPDWWKELNIPKGTPGVTCAVRWYNGWTGELWKTDIIPYGASCPDPGNPCIAGFEFIGWEGNWENVTEDRNIRAWYFVK